MSIRSLNNVRIVLVGTTHPGNIGAAARAMKTMGQHRLYLVQPRIYPSAEATARATGADDVLAAATVCTDLKSAISDCELVIATTARQRSLAWPTVTPRECARRVGESAPAHTAILFGRESSGLTNTELELSNLMLRIPANPDYSSLNLAAAVQIVCYELLMASLDACENQGKVVNEEFATQKELELFYEHLEQCMIDLNYLDPDNPRKLMHRMRRLFNRSHLEKTEWRILRGLLASIQEKIK